MILALRMVIKYSRSTMNRLYILKKLILGEQVDVERNGHQQTIKLPVNLIGKLIEKKRSGLSLFSPRVPTIAFLVPDTSNAAKAGLKRYDKVVGIDSNRFTFYDEYRTVMHAKKNQ